MMISRPLRPVHHAVQGFAGAHRGHREDIFGLIPEKKNQAKPSLSKTFS
jgi:hypothetical protein